MNSVLTKISTCCSILLLSFASFNVIAVDNTELYNKSLEILEKRIFDHRLLSSDWYKSQQNATKKILSKQLSLDEFITEFNSIWSKGKLSHIRLDKTNRTASQIYDFVENMNAGDSASSLTWEDDIPIITLNSMMGQDTIKRINQFYQKIVKKEASSLIIDLRANKGGAFAIKPLLGHLIDKKLTIGGFVTRSWYVENASLPSLVEIADALAYKKESLKGFWDHLDSNPISKTELTPKTPLYSGQVFVLMGATTESAAEMAVDALSNLSNVTLIGKKTAGKMLSQKMYDVVEGIQLSVPIANYISLKNGVIEGAGIHPKIDIGSAKAMEAALKMARSKHR